MADSVIFEADDDLSESNIGKFFGQPNLVDYVVRDVSSSIDFGNNTVDYTEGEVVVTDSNNRAYLLDLDARTGKSLTDAATNHVFVKYDPTTDDSIEITINTTGTSPTDPNIKIEEIDTSADTSTEFNRNPDVGIAKLTGDVDVDGNDITGVGALDTDSLSIGGKLYELDDNNPIDVTASSVNYTVAGDFDEVIILPHAAVNIVGFDELQVNGDTGNNYETVDNADVQTSGQAAFSIPRAESREYLTIADRGGTVRISAKLANSLTGQTVGGQNANLGGNGINQFTLQDSGGTSRRMAANVYGRQIA